MRRWARGGTGSGSDRDSRGSRRRNQNQQHEAWPSTCPSIVSGTCAHTQSWSRRLSSHELAEGVSPASRPSRWSTYPAPAPSWLEAAAGHPWQQPPLILSYNSVGSQLCRPIQAQHRRQNKPLWEDQVQTSYLPVRMSDWKARKDLGRWRTINAENAERMPGWDPNVRKVEGGMIFHRGTTWPISRIKGDWPNAPAQLGFLS